MYLYIKFHSRNSMLFHHKSVSPKLLSSTFVVVWLFRSSTCTAVPGFRVLIRARVYSFLGKSTFMSSMATPWLCPGRSGTLTHCPPSMSKFFSPAVKTSMNYFTCLIQDYRFWRHVICRWHHSSGDCSGSLCCMGWCHAAATECAETF